MMISIKSSSGDVVQIYIPVHCTLSVGAQIRQPFLSIGDYDSIVEETG